MKRHKTADFSIVLLMCVFFLQALRNVNSIIYAFVLVGSYIFALVTNFRPIRPFKSALVVLFILFFAALPFISFLQMPVSEFITALVRYGGGAMVISILLFCRAGLYRNTERILKAFVIIVLMASFFIIYQVFFGRLSLFDFSTTNGRLGHERYGSLLGASTVFSTIAPIATLALNHFRKSFNGFYRLVSQFLIIVAGFFSLSKAFIVNILLVYFLLFVMDGGLRKKTLHFLKKHFILLILAVGVLFALLPHTVFGLYFNEMLNYSFDGEGNGVFTDLLSRMTALPMAAFSFHDINGLSVIFGVGFKGYAGVLGLYDYPMAHNNYVDIVLSQGLFFAFLILFLYLELFFKSSRQKTPIGFFTKSLIVYILVNMFAGQYNYLHVFSMIFLSLMIVNCEYRPKKLPLNRRLMAYSRRKKLQCS